MFGHPPGSRVTVRTLCIIKGRNAFAITPDNPDHVPFFIIHVASYHESRRSFYITDGESFWRRAHTFSPTVAYIIGEHYEPTDEERVATRQAIQRWARMMASGQELDES